MSAANASTAGLPGPARMPAAAASVRAGSRPVMPTRAPSAASPVAVALPMPPVPPVTSTHLPAIEGASVMACSCLAAVGKLDNLSLVPGGQPGCAGAVAGEECQDFAGRCQSPAVRHWQRSAKRQAGLDLVAVPAAVLVLDDVPGPG